MKKIFLLAKIFCITFVITLFPMERYTNAGKKLCSKCNLHYSMARFVDYCKTCDLKVCGRCNIQLSSRNPIFFDKNVGAFFIKSTCFNCSDPITLIGTAHYSDMREIILATRVMSGVQYQESNELNDISEDESDSVNDQSDENFYADHESTVPHKIQYSIPPKSYLCTRKILITVATLALTCLWIYTNWTTEPC